MERICVKCGKVFNVPKINGRFSRKKYCDSCGDWNKNTKELTCKNCGQNFTVERSVVDNRFLLRDYCTEECRKEYYAKTHPKEIKYKICKICKQKFEVKITESGQYSSVQICDDCVKKQKEKVCKFCGKTFYPRFLESCNQYSNSSFCSDNCEKQYYYNEKLKRFPRYRLCEVCGKEFEEEWLEDKNRYSESLYCSDVCYRIGYKRKREQTLLEKYGVTHHLKLQEFRDKQKNTCLKKYGVPYAAYTPQCLEKNLSNNSKVNKDFANLLEVNGIHYTTEYCIENYRYDFCIQNKNILIEINPNHTHSTIPSHWERNRIKITGKTLDYHLNKTFIANKYGYRCIHVWQWDDWNKIMFLLRDKERLYARKLQLKEISKTTANEFLNLFHIQNSCYGNQVNLGLYQNDQLVQVITFGKPRYNKNYQWELLRLCSHVNYIIIGGAEKLFKHFIKIYQPESVISYCDMSKFNGDVYERLGFKLQQQTKPQKIWGLDTNKKDYITDNLLRQHGFDQLVGSKLNPPQLYGKGTDNEELMLKYGWLPIYDCGQKVFVWKNNE
nr:MAG TPA: endonuclease-like protein [Caudoviricetes sp.]